MEKKSQRYHGQRFLWERKNDKICANQDIFFLCEGDKKFKLVDLEANQKFQSSR
jgi:hypothetical protein